MTKSTLLADLQQLQADFNQALAQAEHELALEQVRIKFLSRQGLIPEFVKQIKDLAPADKIKFGPQLQEFRKTSEQEFLVKKDLLLTRAQSESNNLQTSSNTNIYHTSNSSQNNNNNQKQRIGRYIQWQGQSRRQGRTQVQRPRGSTWRARQQGSQHLLQW